MGGHEAVGGINSMGHETVLEVRGVYCFDYTDIFIDMYVCPN